MVLRRDMLPLSNTFGTKVEAPKATREEAIEAAVTLLEGFLRCAPGGLDA